MTHSSLSYLVFQSIVLLAKTWRGHLEIGSRNNNSRCLASPHLQNSSYLFFSRVVCILDCFPCTLIELNYQKKVKKPNLVSFLEMDSIRKMKYCYLMSLFMWTCENLKSLFFHIFSTWKMCEGIFSFRYFPCWCISSVLLYRTPILRHFLRRQCKQRSLKIEWSIFVIINSSAALWMTQSSVSSVWHKLCLCSSSKFGFLLKLSTWLYMTAINC